MDATLLKLGGRMADSHCVDPRPSDRLGDTTLVSALIAGRLVCLDCIAKRCSLTLTAAETVVTVIERAVELHRRDASRCDLCGKSGVVFSIDPPRSNV